MSHEGALNSRAGTNAQANESLSSVFRVSLKITYVLHSLTQGVLGLQLGTRAGTSTQIPNVKCRVDQLPGYKFTTCYPNANYRMYK